MTKDELVKQEYNNLMEAFYKRTKNNKIKETVVQSAVKVVQDYYLNKEVQQSKIENTELSTTEELYEAVKWFAYGMSDNHHNSYFATSLGRAFSMTKEERDEYKNLSVQELFEREGVKESDEECEV